MTQTTAANAKKDRRNPRAEALLALNEGAAEGARIVHEGSFAFGGSMSVQKYRLGNGLTVLLSVDASAPVVSYHTWFAVGSRHEKTGKTGLAHLFEHLMFNETEKHPAGSFDRMLEEAGAESNAATWVDWTFYHESIPKDRIGLVIGLEAERMSRLVLREPQVKSEKEVVANERRYRVDDDVEGAVSELLYKTAYTKHAYGWPTIGWMADIEGFTTGDCSAFYRTYYSPNNATVVAVGDFREKDILSKIQKAYGALARAEIPVEDVAPEPPQTEERRTTVKKPTATDKIAMAYHGPAFGDVDHVPLTILSEVLFSGRSSRCHRVLIQEEEVATELRGWVGTFRDPGLFEIYATARPGKTADEVLALLDRELGRVVVEPVTDAELDKVKAKVELSLVQSLETASGKAEQIGFYYTVLGDPVGAFSRLEAYRRTTRSDLLRVARRYLADHRRTVVFVHPESPAPERG
ncbi:MAG TPA: pitrilysin family protein [Polyangiaceae bacterium]|nr:pitrilysin family protein [Polyangiaceae bacterium]